jgi:PAS domain S-box-containing protein
MALSNGEEEYRSLFANFLDVVYVVKPDGIITFISPQIARYGYRPEDVLSHNIIEFITPDCREYVLNKFRMSQERGETFPTDFKIRASDGQTYWLEALGKNIYDDSGRPLHQVGVLRDITQRRRAEEALRESEEKFRILADSSRAGIIVVQGEKII